MGPSLRVVRDPSGAASLLPMEAPARTVRPPSATREAAGVGAALAVVLVAAAVRVLVLRGAGVPAAPATTVLQGGDQSVFQALLVSTDAIGGLRKRTATWPGVPELVTEELPPFNPSLLPAAARGLSWTLSAGGASADYAGIDPQGLRTAFLLRVTERSSGGLDQSMPTSARRPGVRLAAEVWIRKGGTALPGVFPATDGWFKLVALDGEASGGRP
jgi:hypothetical protein